MITSLENQLVKKVTSLFKKKYREETGLFFVEGIKSVKEALNSDFEVTSVIYSSEMINYNLEVEGIDVSKEVLCKMCDTITPQGIIALCKIPNYSVNTLEKMNKIIYLDHVQDPGNVGTIIRTADAFSFDAVVLSKECADLYSPKVIRSTMGSIFHLPIFCDTDLNLLKSLNKKIYSSSLEATRNLESVEIIRPFALVIGSEGQGISNETKELTDEFVKIDMPGNAESLNASIAAGILIYEFSK